MVTHIHLEFHAVMSHNIRNQSNKSEGETNEQIRWNTDRKKFAGSIRR